MNHRHPSRLTGIFVAGFVAILGTLSACGSSATYNDADVMFAQMMIPHHEQAIELADMALDPTVGASEAIRQLATQIKANQDPEISFMTTWLADNGESVVADDGVDHSSMMRGMLTVDDLESLRVLRGAEFDRAWIAAMIAHHEGAIDMALAVQADGRDTDIETLAAAIIEVQKAEIELLGAL